MADTPSLLEPDDQPLAYPTSVAPRVLGIGRTKLFEEIRNGRLNAKRNGGKIVILREEALRYLQNLDDVKPSDLAATG
jgi:hypothetical protein